MNWKEIKTDLEICLILVFFIVFPIVVASVSYKTEMEILQDAKELCLSLGGSEVSPINSNTLACVDNQGEIIARIFMEKDSWGFYAKVVGYEVVEECG